MSIHSLSKRIPNHRWYHFISLVFIISTTIISLSLLFWYITLFEQSRIKHNIINELKTNGIYVIYHHSHKLEWIGLKYIKDVIEIDISCDANDRALELLKEFPNTPSIKIENSKITDSGLSNLKYLHNIHKIYISNSNINLSGLTYIKEQNKIDKLYIIGVANAKMKYLKDMTGLQFLLIHLLSVRKLAYKPLSFTHRATSNACDRNRSNCARCRHVTASVGMDFSSPLCGYTPRMSRTGNSRSTRRARDR